VFEEVGLTVTGLAFVTGGWRDNRCGRAPGPRGYGHDWKVFRATEWCGDLAPSRRETRGVGWYTAARLQELADRTYAAALGRVSREEWEADPGLEGVWCRWLAETGLIALSDARLDVIESFAGAGLPQ